MFKTETMIVPDEGIESQDDTKTFSTLGKKFRHWKSLTSPSSSSIKNFTIVSLECSLTVTSPNPCHPEFKSSNFSNDSKLVF